MTNFLMDATDLQIFDEHGNFITEMKGNMKTFLSISVSYGKFAMENCTLNLDFLKSLGEKEEVQELSDFKKHISEKKTSIKFKKETLHNKNYKIVSKGILYDVESENKSHNFNIVIYNATLNTPFITEAVAGIPFTPEYIFTLSEDKDGNFVDLDLFEV